MPSGWERAAGATISIAERVTPSRSLTVCDMVVCDVPAFAGRIMPSSYFRSAARFRLMNRHCVRLEPTRATSSDFAVVDLDQICAGCVKSASEHRSDPANFIAGELAPRLNVSL